LNTKTKDSASIVSAARQRLASMIAAREEISASIERTNAALTRLASQQTAEGPLVGELAALDAAEAAKMNDWARSSEGDAPLPDVAKREALNRKLADARAKAEAARRAESGLQAELARESAKLPAIARAMDIAIAEVLVEEGDSLIADFGAASFAVTSKRKRIEILRDILIAKGQAGGDGDPGHPFRMLLQMVDGRLQEEGGPRVPDLDAANRHRLGWHTLADRLRSDANAKLES
jgi:hypothetical protein